MLVVVVRGMITLKKISEYICFLKNGTRIYYSNFFDTSREPNGTKNSYTPSIFKQIKDSDNGIVSGIYPANIVDNPFGDERDAIFVATKGKIGNNNNNNHNNTVASANNVANSNNNVEYDNMKESNWFLITSLGTESAFAEISNLRNIFILVTLVVLTGTAIAVFYISRIISKPIMKLKRWSNINSKWKFEYPIQTCSFQRRDWRVSYEL